MSAPVMRRMAAVTAGSVPSAFEAIGRRALSGCLRSRSASNRSLTMYTAPLAQQNSPNAAAARSRDGRNISFLAKMRGANTTRFLIHWRGRIDTTMPARTDARDVQKSTALFGTTPSSPGGLRDGVKGGNLSTGGQDGRVGGMQVAVVIPARNEAASLPLVLDAIPRHLVDEIVVVDNASTDGTAEAALGRGAILLREPRRGYGSACLRGLEHLRARRPDVVVFLDADYSDHPEEMPLLLEPIERGQADLVIGSRVLGTRERGALLPQARVGNWVATRLIRAFYGGRFTDLGPFRAVRFEALERLGMADRDFGWTAE